MVSRRAGMTLLEILVSSLIAFIAVFFLLRLVGSAFSGSVKAGRDYQVKSSAHTVTGSLQKSVASGDTRFFAFSGKGSATPPDKVTLRMFVPLPARCADLSATGCEEDTALLYTHYDKTATPAVSAVCALDERTVIVNLGDQTYGPAQNGLLAGGTGFEVLAGGANTQVSGPIPVARETLLALMTPPTATMWVATRPPQPYNPPNYDPATKTFSPPFSAVSNCGTYFQPPGGVPPTLGALYRVRVRPLLLRQFTGGSTVSDVEAVSAMGQFPQRLFNAQVRSMGMIRANGQEPMFGVMPCTVAVAGSTTTLACAGPAQLVVPGVARVRFRESFKMPLFPVPATRPDVFELLGSGQTLSGSCVAPTCLSLGVGNIAAVRVYYDTSETSYVSLSAAGFSLLKQEVVSHLGIVLSVRKSSDLANNDVSEEVYDVPFP